jgi:hypothetical protein
MKPHPIYNSLLISENGEIHSKRGILKQTLNSDGYFFICTRIRPLAIRKSVHRLVAETYVPNPENKEQVHHKDENRTNNHFTNLKWVTKKEHEEIHNNEKSQRMIGNKIAVGSKGQVGRKFTDEHKLKMSFAAKNRKH